MTAQRLYDLIVEADWHASDSDLDHCAFLLESFDGIDWLRALINEDAKRLANLMTPPMTPLSQQMALFRAVELQVKGGYVAKLALEIFHDRARALTSGSAEQIKRKAAQTSQKTPETPARSSVEQRLYELITAIDAVDTDFHVKQVAEMLSKYRADVLDSKSLVQDAPRVAAALAHMQPSPDFLQRFGDETTESDLKGGLHTIKIIIDLYRGALQEVALLLKELFAGYGAEHGTGYPRIRQLLAQKVWPNRITVERIAQKTYTCLYVWMIEDNYGYSGYSHLVLDKPLVESAKVWDRDLVEQIVQPLVAARQGEKLLKFVVCVANNRIHAKQLAERHANEWKLYTQGHLFEQLDARDARHVVLLEKEERPRAIFVWGNSTCYQSPDSGGFRGRL
jgi:hypothetical protein